MFKRTKVNSLNEVSFNIKNLQQSKESNELRTIYTLT